jgi:hypothetical protein
METSGFNAPAAFMSDGDVGPLPRADTTTLGAYLGNADLTALGDAAAAAAAAAAAGEGSQAGRAAGEGAEGVEVERVGLNCRAVTTVLEWLCKDPGQHTHCAGQACHRA